MSNYQGSHAKIFTDPVPPLPYHPALRTQLYSATAALVFTYLEIEHPAQIDPQDAAGGLLDGPYYITIGELVDRLQINSRTLQVALYRLSSLFKEEEEMYAAKRAGRQFLVPHHSQTSQIKPYASVGFFGRHPSCRFALFRNYPRINAILRNCALQPFNLANPLDGIKPLITDVRAVSALKAKNLAEILASANADWSGDRRRTRYTRARAAIAAGLAGPEILQVSRRSDYQRWTPERKAAHSEVMRQRWAKRKGSMDNMSGPDGTP